MYTYTNASVAQTDPARAVQIYIDLVHRHEQSFYAFVHKVHSKGDGLFSSLMQWIELFLTLIRDGIGNGQKLSLEFILPHTGTERAEIMKEVDAVALYHYKLKAAYQDKVRRRFGKTQGMDDADAADETTAALLEGVVQEVSFGDLVKGEADDLAAEEDEEDGDSSDEWGSDSESGSEEDLDEDGSDGTDDSGSREDSDDGASTERNRTPERNRNPHISKASLPPIKPVNRALDHSRHGPSQSVNISPTQPSMRPARSMTFSHPMPSRPPPPLPGTKDLPLSPHEKPLPAPPRYSYNRRSLSRTRGARSRERPSSPRKHKRHAALQPPELHHIPELLPLFVEMVCGSL